MEPGRRRRVAVRAVLGLAAVLLIPRALAQGDGIFADFTTGMGSFTCQLFYTSVPRTVASFVGLATGQRAWLDETTGGVRTNAFFDGLTFHRVIAGFMIQSGSPNGEGDDGPGYAFPDEFDPFLRHNGPGVLSMANSGPNSNGSQFFVTVTDTPGLDDRHTVFGRVVSGLSVVNAINLVATDPDTDKPLTDVVIQRVAIRRVGAAALAFNIHAQNLPVVSRAPLRIAAAGGGVSLFHPVPQYAAQHLSLTTNLNVWSPIDLGIELGVITTNEIPLGTTAPARFFALSQVQYPFSTFAPRTLHGRTLVLEDGDLGFFLTIAFNQAGGGTYTFGGGSPGTVRNYDWQQEPYRGFLWPIYFSGLVPMTFRLDFNSNTSGTFSGTAYTTPSTPLSGVFSVSNP